MSGLIWLASYPKSGNTWLRAFLANYLSNAKKPVSINNLPGFIMGDNLILHYEQFSGRAYDTMEESDIAALRPGVHQWLARSQPRDIFVKTHSAIAAFDGVPLITPAATAGAIYVVRNPLDVAVSFAHHYQTGYDRAVAALCEPDYNLPSSAGVLAQYLGSWERHVTSWTSAQGLTLHVMRYEDMKRKPKKTFGRLVRFLGQPDDAARLTRAIRFSSFNELNKQEKSEPFVEGRPDGKSRFFRAGRIGAGKDVLDESQIQRLVEALGPTMQAWGYLSSSGKLTL